MTYDMAVFVVEYRSWNNSYVKEIFAKRLDAEAYAEKEEAKEIWDGYRHHYVIEKQIR